MECKLKDWGLGALSKLVWRAKLDQKRAVPYPSSPSEVGERVNPSSTGNAGRDRHNGVLGWNFGENGAETWKSDNKNLISRAWMGHIMQ